MADLTISAPLSGVVVPLDQVPDPVFSQKMVGDGISVDPIDHILRAPCAGKIIQLHRAAHAVTIRSAEGIEVLMHIGLDTVNLNGEGFALHVQEGDQVDVGDSLIAFEPDYLATHAKSLLTEIILAGGESIVRRASAGKRIAAGEELLVVAPSAQGTSTGEEGEKISSPPVKILNPHGLHARPAALLAAEAKKFDARITLSKEGREVSAISPVKILTLEIEHGDKVVLAATGAEAAEAVEQLTRLLDSGLGEEVKKAVVQTATAPVQEVAEEPNLFLGVSSSPGLSTGVLYHNQRPDIPVKEKGGDMAAEKALLAEAVEKADGQIRGLIAGLHPQREATQIAIFTAHLELLADPGLSEMAEDFIQQDKSAAWAWKESYRVQAEQLAGLANPVIAGRAADLLDVGRRVLALLTGYPMEAPDLPENAILVARELTPSDTAAFDPEKIAGFCTLGSGATSHVAIIARSLGIPSVAAIDQRIFDVADGTPAILDGDAGTVRINPDAAEVERIQKICANKAAREKEYLDHAAEPAITTDGHRVEIMANITSVHEATRSVELGGDGVGLMRSEFLFLDRVSAPDEKEQQESYAAVLSELKGRPAIIRTLDVGGDKPLLYLPIAPEENPFLGIRGIRAQLAFPDLLRTQIKAMIGAAKEGLVRIMLPMISTLDELRQVRAVVDEENNAGKKIELGIMVEVPATAMMAEQFAKEVDFFSIGTNDLTQYTLAVDRGHPLLAGQQDALNPAVLQLIARTVEGGHKHDCMVGICGGVAGDPQAVPILIGLGLDELSVSVPVIPAVKAWVRSYSFADCQQLAQQALTLSTAAEVRALVPLQEEL